ncbi:N-acetylmuramic acid 6-phosphate etherase [Ignatzschineria sp. LJL83]
MVVVDKKAQISLDKIGTENRNPRTVEIDTLPTLEMVQLINEEDQAVILAVKDASREIAIAIDAIVTQLKQGGRLVYIGAGTSGRLGVLDASESLPTFGVGEEMVIGMIAGGDRALRHPVESAEDSVDAVIEDLKAIHFNEKDILCAIASSGRTPYCIAGIQYAKSLSAKTIGFACVSESEIGNIADFKIEAVVGAEVITGSTRMKSGSAQKMVLNMLSTGSMIQLGKVYSNWMVDVRSTNEKLKERSRKMLMKITDCTYEEAIALLLEAKGHVKSAIVMKLLVVDYIQSIVLLEKYDGHIRQLLEGEKLPDQTLQDQILHD